MGLAADFADFADKPLGHLPVERAAWLLGYRLRGRKAKGRGAPNAPRPLFAIEEARYFFEVPPLGKVNAISPDGPPVPDANTMYCLP